MITAISRAALRGRLLSRVRFNIRETRAATEGRPAKQAAGRSINSRPACAFLEKGWCMSLVKIVLLIILFSAFQMVQSAHAMGQDPNIPNLMRELHQNRWEGPYAVATPLQWDLQLTEPMRKLLDIGPPAQQYLIDNLKDAAIKDQVMILLGGIGDERAVEPIINAMVRQKDFKATSNSERINLAANIALTNITVADVIWHYGGGLVQTEPPKDSKERWMKWWKKNRNFAVKTITHSRDYSNYPNYGIYKQP